MELEGVVQDGVIIPQGGYSLPEGTKVRITSAEVAQPSAPTIWEKLRQLAKKWEQRPCDLPEDLAINHDHYIRGTPKRT